jgi:uncharacterized protein
VPGKVLTRPAVVAALAPVADARCVAAQAATLGETTHRPWPVPDSPWVMGQTWEHLLFAHWPVEPEVLRAVMPPQLAPDVHDGSAWLGVTPFLVRGARLRGTLPWPFVGRFLEVNVRTYTTVDGKPGIFFLSLDAASRLAVAGARRAYRLPYFRARMAATRSGDSIAYRSARVSSDGPPATLALSYEPTGPATSAKPGTLDHFLTERYCLYTLDEAGRVLRADIHHPPWPLQPAQAAFTENTMPQPYGIELPQVDPLLHYSARQDVVIWRTAPA